MTRERCAGPNTGGQTDQGVGGGKLSLIPIYSVYNVLLKTLTFTELITLHPVTKKVSYVTFHDFLSPN